MKSGKIYNIAVTIFCFAMFCVMIISLGMTIQHNMDMSQFTYSVLILFIMLAAIFYAIMFLHSWKKLWSGDDS